MQGRGSYGHSTPESTALSLEDLSMRLHNMVRSGRVEQIDHNAEKVRVKIGGVLTGWIPWGEADADTDASWNPPGIGTQVIVTSQSGDLSNGVVTSRLRQRKFPGPSKEGMVKARTLSDGTVETHDKATKTRTLRLPDDGSYVIEVGETRMTISAGGVHIEAHQTTVSGNLRVGSGATVTFTTPSGQTVTFQNGILVNVY